jgi:DNA polymerase-3 subunit delta'
VTRTLDFVLGHSEIIQKITDSFESGRPGQTYLFVGPAGIGKRYAATGFAQALLCPQSPRGCENVLLVFKPS